MPAARAGLLSREQDRSRDHGDERGQANRAAHAARQRLVEDDRAGRDRQRIGQERRHPATVSAAPAW